MFCWNLRQPILHRSTAEVGKDGSYGLERSWAFQLYLPFLCTWLSDLTDLIERALREGHSSSVIESASYSIRWGHRLAGMDSPTDHPLLKSVVEGARRKLARPVQPKKPLDHGVVTNIALRLNSASASLSDVRFLFILFVGYAGVFRINELLSIRVNDISFFDDYMKVFLIKRKNDQYRDGHVSVIARSRKLNALLGFPRD